MSLGTASSAFSFAGWIVTGGVIYRIIRSFSVVGYLEAIDKTVTDIEVVLRDIHPEMEQDIERLMPGRLDMIRKRVGRYRAEKADRQCQVEKSWHQNCYFWGQLIRELSKFLHDAKATFTDATNTTNAPYRKDDRSPNEVERGEMTSSIRKRASPREALSFIMRAFKEVLSRIASELTRLDPTGSSDVIEVVPISQPQLASIPMADLEISPVIIDSDFESPITADAAP